MKALMYLGPGELAMRDVAEPSEGLVLQVVGCGLCGTDLKTWRSGHHLFPPPAVLGHEFYGRIVASPKGSAHRVGDLLAVAPYAECGECATCARGAGELCKAKGYVEGGAFCERVGIPEAYASKGLFPVSAEDDAYTLVEPLACVLNGVSKLGDLGASRVLVVGGGPMGALFALHFVSTGVPATVVEPSGTRRARIASWGVEALEPGRARIGDYDKIVIAVNKAALFDEYIKGAADAAAVLMFSGLPKGEAVAVDSHSIHYREVSLVGSFGYALPHYRAALAEIEADRAGYARVITHVLPLEEGRAAFELAASGEAFKIVLRP